jgi:hypothetical protein
MKPLLVRCVVGVCLTTPVSVAVAQSNPGDLLWEDRLDTGPSDQAFAAASLKSQVFVAGFGQDARLGRDFLDGVRRNRFGGGNREGPCVRVG